MAFKLADNGFSADIILDSNEYSGVKKVAMWLAEDVARVSGSSPNVVSVNPESEGIKDLSGKIIAGTIGKSSLIEKKAAELDIDLTPIKGKREVYGVFVKGDTVLVAGSEKRGTIYGLLHLSETIGVTPLVFWGDTVPVKYSGICFMESSCAGVRDNILYVNPTAISKEPSVRYRGFFINDEWPAFGNWCNKHFGGFTVECYEKVFEYLLRLKGNYMWPAMWSSIFSMDGPDLKSAELADELGVVMGTSHHEPCCRAGEEFQKLKKTYPEYGMDWSFLTNREGVTRFWEDGLKRNGKFENVITVGMRGEADSKLFADATLQDNINVLKNVINCQKELINKYTDGKQPLMLAVYKEVEEYYKGDENTPGLKDWDGLDGITLMLCDDNFGNLRLMMDDNKRDHKGGYGMYYHFDYHGGPVSYEWINSSYLPKIWEQMTTAYDFGIRDIWIVNTGDLKNQELPLSYFMDLAYDFEKYGTSNPGNYEEYLKDWVNKQFAGVSAQNKALITEITDGYTRLNNIVKPEVLSDRTYSIEFNNEAGRVLDIALDIEKKADDLMHDIEPEYHDTYISLVGFQALATCNLIKMWIYAALNKKYAAEGRVTTNKYAKLIKECIKTDKKLTELFHNFAQSKWYGMGMSKHIGFRAWNEEGCRMPVMVYLEPEAGNDLVVSDDDSSRFSGGGPWTRRPLKLNGFDYFGEGHFTIASAGRNPITYTIECEDKAIIFKGKDSKYVLSGMADAENDVHITVQAADGIPEGRHEFMVKTNGGSVKVFFEIKAETLRKPEFKDGVKTLRDSITAVYAEDYAELVKTDDGGFKELKSFGRLLPGDTHSAIKAFPQDIDFVKGPKAVYKVDAATAGKYKMVVYTAPSNPSAADNYIPFKLKVNDTFETQADTIPQGYVGGENSCGRWCVGVLENIRKTKIDIELKAGINTISFEASKPGFVLEKFELSKDGIEIPYSRLGCL